METTNTDHKPLSLFTKIIYGSGDLGIAGWGTLRQIFYAIFLTDVVGLDARLASFAALIGVIWDAINDPLVGMLSDRVQTRWGRRRPFLDEVAKLSLLKSVVAVRDSFKDVIDIQIVAFPQFGLADNPESVDLVRQAMEEGADIVGGVPHREKDMDKAARQIELAFEIALANDADVDMHVDETDDPYWHTLELLAEKTIETGYQINMVLTEYQSPLLDQLQ